MDLLDKMATFVRVVEAGSFATAAHQLGISSGAVSKQIALLESSVKTSLLLRSTRRMTVTPAGRAYYERCVRILRDVDDAQASAKRGEIAGPLRVTASVTFGIAALTPVLPAFRAKHPDIRIDLRLEDRFVDLALDDVDVALRIAPAPPLSGDIVATPLFEIRRTLVASPAYLRRHGVPRAPADLAGRAILAFSTDERWDLLGPDGATARVPIAPVFRSNALHVLQALAIAGDGIAMLTDFVTRDAIADRRLRLILPGWTSRPMSVFGMHRTSQRGEARVRAFIDYLRLALAK